MEGCSSEMPSTLTTRSPGAIRSGDDELRTTAPRPARSDASSNSSPRLHSF